MGKRKAEEEPPQEVEEMGKEEKLEGEGVLIPPFTPRLSAIDPHYEHKNEGKDEDEDEDKDEDEDDEPASSSSAAVTPRNARAKRKTRSSSTSQAGPSGSSFLVFVVFYLSCTTPTPPRLRGNGIVGFAELKHAKGWIASYCSKHHPNVTITNPSALGIAPRNMKCWSVLMEPARKCGTVVRHVYWVEEVMVHFGVPKVATKGDPAEDAE